MTVNSIPLIQYRLGDEVLVRGVVREMQKLPNGSIRIIVDANKSDETLWVTDENMIFLFTNPDQ